MKIRIGLAAAAAVLAAAVVGFARPGATAPARAEGGGLAVFSDGGGTTVFTASEDGSTIYVWRAKHMPGVEGQRASWTVEKAEAGSGRLTVTTVR